MMALWPLWAAILSGNPIRGRYFLMFSRARPGKTPSMRGYLMGDATFSYDLIATYPEPVQNHDPYCDRIFEAFPDQDPVIGTGRPDMVAVSLCGPVEGAMDHMRKTAQTLLSILPEGTRLDAQVDVRDLMPPVGTKVTCTLSNYDDLTITDTLMHVDEDDVTWRTADDGSEINSWTWSVVFWHPDLT